jgi:hypothetical protein
MTDCRDDEEATIELRAALRGLRNGLKLVRQGKSLAVASSPLD